TAAARDRAITGLAGLRRHRHTPGPAPPRCPVCAPAPGAPEQVSVYSVHSIRGAIARLSRNQARSSTDRSRPRRSDCLINRGAAPQAQGRVSIASYSRNVTYGPKGVLDARTNSKWIPLGHTGGRMGAATNQAAEEGNRVVRNGRISARNSAPGVGTSPQDAKKASRNLLSRLALRMSGRLDSNQRPPEPHSRSLEGEFLGKHVPFASCGFLRF